tara:strand:- start:47 stop:286 length:240 start_codon:yes stop_codon:yes gene_type:complete
MKRVIVDYANAHSELLSRIDEMYAPSYQFDKFITFKSSDGKTKKCIEIKLNDTIYLVKMDRFLDFDKDENDDYDGPIPE